MLCDEELKIISANDPQTFQHLKELKEKKIEVERTKLRWCFFKSILYLGKLVGSFPGKVSNKLDHSGTFLVAH